MNIKNHARAVLLKAFCLCIVYSLFFAVPKPSFAETHVSDDSFTGLSSVTWSAVGSPYILDTDAYFSPGVSLTIDAGVSVFAATDTPTPKSIYVNGSLIINGTKDKPVSVSGIGSFYISRSNSLINNLVLKSSGGLNLNHSTSTIISGDISGSATGNAISARASTVNVRLSKVRDSAYGIYSYYAPSGPFLARSENMGGIGNATGDDPTQNHISIASSSIVGNTSYSIYNQTSNTIDAPNNWWGSADGPGASTYGPVDVVPWLTEDLEGVVCCSNVLFIPGFEGSRLYKDEKGLFGGIFGTSTNTLWEPNRNDDVRKLFMTPSGQSANSGVYTKDIIDSVFGFGIYKNFISMMNGVVADGFINKWVASPYDWRYSVDDIASTSGGLASSGLVSQIQSLASTSKTGKVTIVAHSNGGLVTKMLMKKLTDDGHAGLIDKIIFVAVPELGTPQAVAGLLHGDKQSIFGGFILNKSVARQLGENSPGAYGLLPSPDYFSGVSGSIISFATSTLSSFHLAGNSQTLSSYDALRGFLSGALDHRPNPSASDTDSPIRLSSLLLGGVKKIHNTIDAMVFASSTKIVSLVGWGNPTLAGLYYFDKIECFGQPTLGGATRPQCSTSLAYIASTTNFGDGVVVGHSAKTPTLDTTSVWAKNFYFDLASQNQDKFIKDDHSTILNTDSGVAFVKQQILAENSGAGQMQQHPLPQYISEKEPTDADIHDNELKVTIHSPVELHAYDSLGHHTGLIPNPDPTSDLRRYETGIPGSDYYHNDDNGTYITVPYGTDYQIVLNGIGTGSFGVDVTHNINGKDISKESFVDIPVSPLLKAKLVFSTSTPSLLLDFDGDGTIDASTTPIDHYSAELTLVATKTIFSSLEKDSGKRKQWLDKFDKIRDHLRRGIPLKNNGKKQPIFDKFTDEHWERKGISEPHRLRLLELYRSMIDAVDAD